MHRLRQKLFSNPVSQPDVVYQDMKKQSPWLSRTGPQTDHRLLPRSCLWTAGWSRCCPPGSSWDPEEDGGRRNVGSGVFHREALMFGDEQAGYLQHSRSWEDTHPRRLNTERRDREEGEGTEVKLLPEKHGHEDLLNHIVKSQTSRIHAFENERQTMICNTILWNNCLHHRL